MKKGKPKKIERKVQIIEENAAKSFDWKIEEVMDEETVKKIRISFSKLSLKESLTEEELDSYAKSLCQFFQCFDHDARTLTTNQISEYLAKLEGALLEVRNLIDKAPPEIRGLISSHDINIPEPLEALSPYHNNIIKFGYLVSRLKQNNEEYLKTQTSSLKEDKSDRSYNGKQKNPHLENLSDFLYYLYLNLTGKPISFTYSEKHHTAKGTGYDFMKDVFDAGGIDASPENQIREMLKRFKKFNGANNEK